MSNRALVRTASVEYHPPMKMKFDVSPVFRSTPFADKIIAIASFENDCGNGYLACL